MQCTARKWNNENVHAIKFSVRKFIQLTDHTRMFISPQHPMFINPSNPAPRHQKNPPHPLEFSRSLLTPSFTDRIVHLLLRSKEPSASYSFFFAFSPQSKRIPLGKAWCDGEQILILTSSSPRAYALIFTSAFARDTFILTSCPSRIEWTTCFFLIFLIFSGTSAQTTGFFFLLHQTALTWYTPMVLPLELELVRFFLTDIVISVKAW